MASSSTLKIEAPTVKDIDGIAGANGGHAIALETVLANGDKQWVCLNVEDASASVRVIHVCSSSRQR